MNRHTLGLGLIALLAVSFVGSSRGTTITFDDVSAASVGTIPDGYKGFNWNQFGFIKDTVNPGSGYDNGVVSGSYVAYNEFANVAAVDDSGFTFNSAYFTGAWNNGLGITVEGFLGAVLVHTTTFTVDTTGPTFKTFNWTGIDRLVFDSFGGVDANAGDGGSGEHFAMDNMTINEPIAAVVPLPAAAGAGVALLGCVGVGRKRRPATPPQ